MAGYDPDRYEAIARSEASSFWFQARNQVIAWALQRDFPQARSLLEIGCGTGVVLGGLARAAPQLELTGTDIHPEALAIARTRSDAALHQMDARHIPYAGEFDVVGAFDVIEHVPEDTEVLAQMRSAVRPGGGIVVTVPQHPWLWSDLDERARHQRRYKRSELVEKVRNAGFKVRRVTSFVTLLLPAMALARILPRGRRKRDIESELVPPAPLNAALKAIMRVELALLRSGASLPIGGSLLLTAVPDSDRGAEVGSGP
jgi:2-polyprenyl-3-methyl-5-hydroxy-6-metoxy-1,4-benzoquinol methylase